jgi:hypothetical protein
MLAAKQHELTYYRQRDGIVKSVDGLIRPGHAVCGPIAALAPTPLKKAEGAFSRLLDAFEHGHHVTLS